MDRDEIIRVLRAFEAAGLEYVLIGATAIFAEQVCGGDLIDVNASI